MRSRDDEEGNKFWKKVIDRMKEAEGVNGMIIFSFVRFDILKKMYENFTDRKVIIDQRYDYQPNSFVNSNG